MVRAASVEVYLSANTDEVKAAEKTVKDVGDRISKKTIEQKVTGNPKDAIEGMERVEEAAKRLVSKETALRVDADITRTEESLGKVRERLDGLQVRALGGLDVTASTKRAETEIRRLERTLAALQSAKTQIEVDPGSAVNALVQVERATTRLVSKRFAIKMNAEVDEARSDVERLEKNLEGLRKLSPSVNVTATIDRAESNLREAKGKLDELEGRRATMVVDVSDRFARQQLAGVSEVAGKAGGDSGKEFNRNIIAALAGIPIAGAVLGVGILAGKALIDGLQDGLQQEVGRDRLQALTGIDEGNALRLSRIAGEAYTRGFGESIEQNMDITRLGLQFQLIPAEATQRDAQKVVEGLGGIADALGEDVRPVATTVTTLLRTGLARSASEAFDILAVGQQRGLNRAEDLLDTFQEYPVVLRRLGLDAEDSLGLLNQGLIAGARNSDVVADALKEFQIRGSDASEASAKGFERLGLSAADMTAKVAAGGEGAREALGLVLDRLRETEDPVVRNAAAVELFGTKAEDLGEALFALDPRTAAEGLGLVEGAARRMFETLSDNDASRIDQAKRNIEVAADGIKGALAAAFAEPLGELATFVSENRGPVSEFLLGLVTGALDFGEAMVNAAADGTEAFGEFLAGPGADAVETLASVQKALNPFADVSALKDLAEDMRGMDTTAAATADTIRDRLIAQGLDPARERVLAFGEGVVQMGYLNDASLRLADAVAEVGYKADGTKLSLDGVDTANLRGSESGREFAGQVRDAVGALGEEIDAAAAAGEAQDALTGRYNAGVGALISQMTQMGLTQEQARALIDTILETPGTMTTAFGSNAVAEQGKVQSLADRIITLPNGTVVISARTAEAQQRIDEFLASNRGKEIPLVLRPEVRQAQANFQMNYGLNNARGNIVEFMAAGGLRGLNPMQPIAQVVPPSTWRVVGDRSDVAESYIPLDGSARSMAILLETMRRMGVLPMASGGVLDRGPAPRSGGSPTVNVGPIYVQPDDAPEHYGRAVGIAAAETLTGRLG